MQCFFHTNEYDDEFWRFTPKETAIYHKIVQEIRTHNPFLRTIKVALENNTRLPLFRLVISDKPPPNAATRTFNRPTSNEVAVIITGAEDDTNTALERQVLIHERSGGVTAIPSHHSS